MSETIPLRWANQNPSETARRFLDAPDDKHPMWAFLDAPIEADFPITPETLAPYVVDVLDQMAEIEACGVAVAWIKVKGGVVKVI